LKNLINPKLCNNFNLISSQKNDLKMFSLKKSLSNFAIIAIAMTVFTMACKQETVQSVLTESQTAAIAEQTIKASQFFTNSFAQSSFASTKANGLKEDERNPLEVRGACSDPTVSPNDFFTFPKVVTINYGSGCTDDLGRNKSGKMTLNVGKFWETGSVITANFENFMEDSTTLNGSYTFTNNSTATTIDHLFVAQNIVFKDKTGKTTTYTINQRHKQTGGMNTFTPRDDVFEISTTVTSKLADGTLVSWQNTTPLIKKNNCRWIQKGTGTIKVNNETSIIDFGNDTCDDDATLTTNGVVKNIKL
jgi:hypothetical protein